MLFLKENSTIGDTWISSEYTGTILGVPAKVKYSFTTAAVNSTVIVNSVTYNNVIEVDWKSVESINGAAYADAVIYKSYYSKGIGMIKQTQDYNTAHNSELLRHYHVY